MVEYASVYRVDYTTLHARIQSTTLVITKCSPSAWTRTAHDTWRAGPSTLG